MGDQGMERCTQLCHTSGEGGWKSVTALKSENINGRQSCGTLGAVMASLACADGGSRHSSVA